MVKKSISKKSSKKIEKKETKHEKKEELSYINWKIPVAFLAGVLLTVLYYNLPDMTSSTEVLNETFPTLFILNDANCALCNSSWIAPRISQDANVSIVYIDANSAEGQSYISSLGITSLPAAFLSKDFENTTAFSTYDYYGYLIESGNYYVLNIEGTKDLSIEESENAKLDLFVMSECPYGTPAQENAIALKKAIPDIELNMYYIASSMTATELETYLANYKESYDYACSNTEYQEYYDLECTDEEWASIESTKRSSYILQANGKYYNSLHGAEEIENDIIQVCAMNLSDNWMDFILAHIDSDFNASYAAEIAGIDYNELMSCANSTIGLDLLDANIAVTETLGISSSPTYIFDNVYVNPSAVYTSGAASVMCTLHSELSGCENVDSIEVASATGSC